MSNDHQHPMLDKEDMNVGDSAATDDVFVYGKQPPDYYSEWLKKPWSDPKFAAKLIELADVDAKTAPTDGQSPVFDKATGKFLFKTSSGGAKTFADLTDTTITKPADGQAVMYAAGKLVNRLLKSADVSDLDLTKYLLKTENTFKNLAGKKLTTPKAGQALVIDDPAAETIKNIDFPSAGVKVETIKADTKKSYDLDGASFDTFIVNLSADASFAIKNFQEGKEYHVIVTQDAKGNHKVVWSPGVDNVTTIDPTMNSHTSVAIMSVGGKLIDVTGDATKRCYFNNVITNSTKDATIVLDYSIFDSYYIVATAPTKVTLTGIPTGKLGGAYFNCSEDNLITFLVYVVPSLAPPSGSTVRIFGYHGGGYFVDVLGLYIRELFKVPNTAIRIDTPWADRDSLVYNATKKALVNYSESHDFSAAEPALDFSVARSAYVMAVADVAKMTVKGGSDYGVYNIVFKQDATGSRKVTWPTNIKPTPKQMPKAPNSILVVTVMKNGADYNVLNQAEI